MEKLKLYMIMLGCTPKGRYTEQHDVFFGIGTSLKNLIPDMYAFWPEAKEKIHIDAWREINFVNGFKVEVVSSTENLNNSLHLFFINLGGYRPNEFDEPHYKMLLASPDRASAIKEAKESAFYKHTGFAGAVSHIDDKYGIDVDDIFEIKDALSKKLKLKYRLKLTLMNNFTEDELHLGYLPIKNIK